MNPDTDQRLGRLRQNFPVRKSTDLHVWLSQRRTRSLQSLMDCAAAAANVALNPLEINALDENPLLAKAIHDTLPNWAPGTALDGAELMGAVSTAKGRYFEYLVAERLNSGESVGGITLPPRYAAELAPAMNNPAWDLEIVDSDGVTADYLQLKATDSMAYVYGAMERYPDITFLVTSEVSDVGGVSNTGISDEAIQNLTQDALDPACSSIDESWALLGGFSTLGLIAARAGFKLHLGQTNPQQAREYVVSAGGQSLAAQSAGFMASWLVGGWAGLPAAIGAYWWLGQQKKWSLLGEQVERATQRLRLLRLHQQEQRLALEG